jgi:hypothetical protein
LDTAALHTADPDIEREFGAAIEVQSDDDRVVFDGDSFIEPAAAPGEDMAVVKRLAVGPREGCAVGVDSVTLVGDQERAPAVMKDAGAFPLSNLGIWTEVLRAA